MGVPQGAVSSPLLWNFFTSDLRFLGYADDFHGFISDPSIEVIEDSLNSVAEDMVEWAVENDMEISAPKSTATLFTPWTKQVNQQLEVKVGAEDVPTVKNPRSSARSPSYFLRSCYWHCEKGFFAPQHHACVV